MARTNKLTVAGLSLWALGAALACTQILGDVCIDDAEHKCEGAEQVVGRAEPVDSEPAPIMSGMGGDPCVEADALGCKGPEFRKCVQGQSGLAWLTLDVCDSGALCSSVGVAGCVAPVCREGDMKCDGASLLMCNEDLTGYTEFALCETAGHCDAGGRACREVPCEPGMLRCNGPELQTCRPDQLDWELMDGGVCETPELCEAGRTRDPALGALPGGGLCPAPECDAGALRCTGATLERCSNGRTGWDTVDACGTAALCELGRANAGSVPGAAPACAPQACTPNGYQCTPAGVLEQCNADLTAYTTVRACDGPAFCNAGMGICTDAPCIAGEEQCSGRNILRCTPDRTNLLATGEVCNTPVLCNGTNPLDAICIPPTCEPGTPNEFTCQGATLLRCNANHNGYDFFAGCASAALCVPSRRAEGCVAQACRANQHSCTPDGFLNVCNGDLTGFQQQENCGSPNRCDATLGRCTDPCVVGAARCSPQGNLEQCRDPLRGWEVTAPCNSVARCDAQARACRDCDPANPLFCQGNTLRRCNPTGFGSVVAPAADGCSSATNRRMCQGGVLQTPTCVNATACDGAETCLNGTCRAGTAVSCQDDGNVCNGNTGCNPASGACNVPGTNARIGTQCAGGVCNGTGGCVGCNPGDACSDSNACTNDSCNTRSTCDHAPKCTGVNDVCIAATGTCVECAEGADCTAPGRPICSNNVCVQCASNANCVSTPNTPVCSNNVCVACLANQCTAQNQFIACRNGVAQPTVNCNDGFSCTTDSCNTTTGCAHAGSNLACQDTSVCNGSETCNPGAASDTRGCVSGTPLGSGASCGTDLVCNAAGGCIRPVCTTNPPSPGQCAAASACRNAETCNLNTFQCIPGATAPRDGESCVPAVGTVGQCRSGNCVALECIVDRDCADTRTPECVGNKCVACDFDGIRCVGTAETTCSGNLLSQPRVCPAAECRVPTCVDGTGCGTDPVVGPGPVCGANADGLCLAGVCVRPGVSPIGTSPGGVVPGSL